MGSEHQQTTEGRRSGGPQGSHRSALTTSVPRVQPGAPLPNSVNASVAQRCSVDGLNVDNLKADRLNVDALTALDFAAAARQLSLSARSQGLVCPLFRSPPDLAGVSRSLRRNQDGTVTVSVLVRGRFRVAVLADMVDGVVAANSLTTQRAAAARDALWQALAGGVAPPLLDVDLRPSGLESIVEGDPLADMQDHAAADEFGELRVEPVAA